ncbi:MAG TPA: hypothetical protein VK610_04000, partial [Rhodothermales bacterium]|nr:hypothetical protein [Rhodothermales bacterium]
ARRAGVGLIAYTSAPHADTTPMKLAAEHRATEEMLAESGVPYVLLRNGWYTENYTRDLAATLGHGVILGSAGEGRVSAAARADYAEAAAAVVAGEGHEGAIYELGGDESFTMADLAAEITRLSGTEVVYRDLPVAAYEEALVGFGLPAPVAAIYADADAAIAQGALLTESGDLRRLIGRPTTPLAETLAGALAEVAA